MSPQEVKERFFAVAGRYKQALLDAESKVGDSNPEVRESAKRQAEIARKGLFQLDTMTKNLYHLNQNLRRLPQGLGAARQAAIQAVAPGLEMLLLKHEGVARQLPATSMGAVTESQFYPEGEAFDWFNPLDWWRNVKYEAAKTIEQGVQVGTEAAEEVYETASLPAKQAYGAAAGAAKSTMVFVAGAAALWIAVRYLPKPKRRLKKAA